MSSAGSTRAAPYHPAWVGTLHTLQDVLDVLDLPASAGPGPVRVANLPTAHGGVLGAQLLDQTVVAAERRHPHKRVFDLHAALPHRARPGLPLLLGLEELSADRPFATLLLCIVRPAPSRARHGSAVRRRAHPRRAVGHDRRGPSLQACLPV